MRPTLRIAPLLSLLLVLAAQQPALARHAGPAGAGDSPVINTAPPARATDNPASLAHQRGLSAVSATDTTWLYSATFTGNPCDPQGWTAVDRTAQNGDYWHVDDYAGLPFGPLAGSKSLWCGVRPGPGPILCQYQTLPGYGNSWDQKWCTKDCLAVAGGATTGLDVSFVLRFDAEPSYDGAALEYTSDCSGNNGWTEIDGGITPAFPDGGWSGTGQVTVNQSYATGSAPVRVRLRFTSDSSWSDEDGFYASNGAVHIDNLKVEDLATETFEDEAVGATAANDWQSCNTGFGNFAGLMKGSDVFQAGDCSQDLSCLWAFIVGSTDYYTCGGQPTQPVVPYVNERGEYISNEIWSPEIPLSGSGLFNLRFDVYRDNPLDALVFYQWHVRTVVNGCPRPWKTDNFLNDSSSRGWYQHNVALGSYVSPTAGATIQVALGVVDLCKFYCGVLGSGQCHTNAPMFDNVKIYRVNVNGPFWSVRAVDLFQDTFSSDGTITGVARANTAIDTKPLSSASFTPGDSSTILSLLDPNYAGTGINTSGLSNDPNLSTFVGRDKTKKQVYMWVAVWPRNQANKSGDGLSEGPGGSANRYPHIAAKDYVDAGGVTWTAIRADYTYTGNAASAGLGTGTQPRVDNRFNVDLNDNLFVPGDTICYFFGATSPGGTTYYSDQWHITDNIAEVAANPMEFTILPAGGFNRGGSILYVDGADGYGSQPYFDSAFMLLGLSNKVDRYDVRSPASGESNTLAGRVTNVAAQLNACYSGIIWDCGSLSTTLGDGTGDPIKCDDYALLNTFMGNAFSAGQHGVYLSGDDAAERLAGSASTSAVTFKSNYIPFNLASGDHIAAGLGVSPKVIHWPGRAFSDDFFVFGGCPELHDFDVLNATGTSRVEMSYGSSQSPNGAVVSNQRVNANGATVTAMLSGFSFAAIRDDETNGISDRAKFLRDMMIITMGSLGQVVPAGPALRNSLAQNYPNPFNPTTTIAFSIKQRANVRLAVYDVNGALVRTLADEARASGAYELKWDGRDDRGRAVASGVYFYKLTAGSFTQTKKMVLLK